MGNGSYYSRSEKNRQITEDEEKTGSLIIQRPDALSLTCYPKQSKKKEAQKCNSPTGFLSTAPPSHYELHITFSEVSEVCNPGMILMPIPFLLICLCMCVSLVLRKGQVVTGYYRWLQKRGGYLWVQSCATVSINHKAPHERNVIWVNYILRSAL